MDACAHHKETLVLDVHGELTPDERTAWHRHLVECEDCRRERERLLALVDKTKKELCVPPLSSEEEQLLSSSVLRTLRTAKPEPRPKKVGWLLAPALAACMVVVVAGWFGLKNLGSGTVAVRSVPVSEEQIIRNNQELLENMELLQEMDSVEQLVRLLDKQTQKTSLRWREDYEDRVRAHA